MCGVGVEPTQLSLTDLKPVALTTRPSTRQLIIVKKSSSIFLVFVFIFIFIFINIIIKIKICV